MATTTTTNTPVIGFGLWKGKSFHGKSIHGAKDSLLVGYDLMSLQGLRACEERLYGHGIEVCRTEVRVSGGKPRDGCLYSLAKHGSLVPYAMEWSCLNFDPAQSFGSAASLAVSYPEKVGIEFQDLEIDALERFTAIPRNSRDKASRNHQRERVLAAFQRLGLKIVPVTLKRLDVASSIKPFVAPDGWRLRKRFKVELDNLVDIHWCGINELEVFAAMARTTWKPKDGGSGPIELLSASSCVNSSSITPFSGKNWREDLERRFRHILLSRYKSEAAKEWCDTNGIALGKTFTVNWPTAEEIDPSYWDADGKRSLRDSEQVDRLLTDRGWLAWSLNTCHPHANRIHGVNLSFGPGGASFTLDYGYSRDSGSWHRHLASQTPGEPLIFTVKRAQTRLNRLKNPNSKPPSIRDGEEQAQPVSLARSPRAEWNPQKWIQEWKFMAQYKSSWENLSHVDRIDDF